MSAPAGDGKPRRLCRLCGVPGRTLRRVGSPDDPDRAVAICPVCDGPALELRPHPRDVAPLDPRRQPPPPPNA